MEYGDARDHFARLKRNHADYTIFDESYARLGKVDEIFVVEDDRLAYIGISRDLFNASLAPIPVEIIQVNDKRGVVVVADSKEHLERAPVIKNENEIGHELEARVRAYFGLDHEPGTKSRRELPREAAVTGVPAPDDRVDISPGERKEAEEIEASPPGIGEIPPREPSRVRRLS